MMQAKRYGFVEKRNSIGRSTDRASEHVLGELLASDEVVSVQPSVSHAQEVIGFPLLGKHILSIAPGVTASSALAEIPQDPVPV